jgi:signal transduction histidine kinase
VVEVAPALSDRSLRTIGLVAVASSAVLIALVPVLGQGIDDRGLVNEAAFDPYDLAIGPAFGLAGLLLVWKRPRNPIGWLLVAFLLAGAVSGAAGAYAMRGHSFPEEHLPGVSMALMPASALWPAQLFLPVTLLLVLYPTGHLPAPWWRWVNRAAVAGMVGVAIGFATVADSTDDWWDAARPALELPLPVGGAVAIAGGVLLVAAAAVSVVGTVVRTWRAEGPERPQLLLLLMTGTVAVLLAFFGPNELVFEIALMAVPFAIAVGILRYGLLGIDIVVGRALLYGALTALVIVVFVGVTAAVSAVVPNGPAPQVVAAALVATGLMPARSWLQHVVDRLVYGERRDPVEAVTRLGEQVMSAEDDEPLPWVLTAFAQSIRAPYVALRGTDGTIVAAHGRPVAEGEPTVIPLRYAGTSIGDLVLGMRPGERSLPATDRRLADALVPPVAFVVLLSRLNADLESARERAVLTALAERDRIRRDLHDGLGPSLSGVALGLEASETAMRSDDPVTAAALTGRLRAEVQSSVEEVRRIIDGLRPPALDELGLVTALRQRAESVSLRSGGRLTVRVDAPDRLPPLPSEVEDAAYRIADEALTNVVRHSGATSCVLRIRARGDLTIDVVDDGRGIASVPRQGVGLDSMRARAESLGGSLELENGHGTRVAARLPVVPA